MQYQVVRQHYGDKQYFDGDVRVVDNDDDASTLMTMGLIVPMGDSQDGDKEQTTPKPRTKQAKTATEQENSNE